MFGSREMKRGLSSCCLGAALVAALLAGPAGAVMVPLGASEADNLVINFDFGNIAQIDNVVVNFGGPSSAGSYVYERYNDLDGVDLFPPSFDVSFSGTPNFYIDSSSPFQFEDGQFSIGLRMTSGTWDLETYTATATIGNEQVTVGGTVVGAMSRSALVGVRAIPEPGTLALVLASALTLVASRRRVRTR